MTTFCSLCMGPREFAVTPLPIASDRPMPYLDDAGADEGDGDGDGVDGQLELEELGDAVVDVATPHYRLDDAREVVVGEDDVGRLLRHVRPSHALSNNVAARK